jgi:hypothetical protein
MYVSVRDKDINKLLMEDFNLDLSDIECGSENDDEEIPLPTSSSLRTYKTPDWFKSLVQEWSDDKDNDPDYNPDMDNGYDDSADEEHMPSTSTKVRVKEGMG